MAVITQKEQNNMNISLAFITQKETISKKFDEIEQLSSWLNANYNSSIKELIDELIKQSLLIRLRRYTGEATIEKLSEIANSEGLPFLTELLNLLDDLREKYGKYGGPYLDCVFDDETGELMYFVAIFQDAGWEEWKEIESYLKLKQTYTKKYLTTLCLKAFRE